MPTKPTIAKTMKTANERRVAPRATKRLGQLAREEQANAFAALCVSAIDATMRADHETVEVIDQTRIARLGTRDREIRSGATIDRLSSRTSSRPKRRSDDASAASAVLESLPGVFALGDESVLRHDNQDTNIRQIL